MYVHTYHPESTYNNELLSTDVITVMYIINHEQYAMQNTNNNNA